MVPEHHESKSIHNFRSVSIIYDWAFCEIVIDFQRLTNLAKCSILDVWLSSEYASEVADSLGIELVKN